MYKFVGAFIAQRRTQQNLNALPSPGHEYMATLSHEGERGRKELRLDQETSIPRPPATGLRHRLINLFGIDLRTLALFRVAIGSLLLTDLALRARDLRAFFTDWGVMPRAALLEKYADPSVLSVYLLGGQPWFVALLFLLAGLFAFMMVIGYRTRLFTVLSWFMLISIQSRNTMIGDGGDDFLRCMMFWAMFLPLGARCSVDAVLNPAPPASNRYASAASAAMLLQVCFVYYFSATLKIHEKWLHGQAVLFALQIDLLDTSLGVYLLNFPRVLVVLTYVTLVLEWLGPVVAMFPLATQRLRLIVIPLFILLHIGLGTCLMLGLFPAICITGWLTFIPSCFWDRLGERWPLSDGRWLMPMIGKMKRRPVRVRPTWIGSAAVLFFLYYALFWNLRTVDFKRWENYLPKRANWVGMLLRIDQHWGMFAPYPLMADGWFVAPGKLVDGTEVDVITGRGVTWDKPPLVSATFPHSRWRKYMTNLWSNSNAGHQDLFARYLCRRWNESHADAGKKMDTFRIFYMREDSTPDAHISRPVPTMLWQHWCIKMPDPKQPLQPADRLAAPPTTRPETQPESGEP